MTKNNEQDARGETMGGSTDILTAPAVAPVAGDVYRFTYSAESWQRAKDNRFGSDLHWCFDGQLVYRDGLLCDTYWGFDWRGDNGRAFTVADAQAKGTLEFVCNIGDVEKIRPDEFALYAEGDAFNLSHQHHCHNYYVKRRGAKKDKALMLAALSKKVQDAHAEVQRAARNLEWAAAQRERLTPRIEAGDEVSI